MQFSNKLILSLIIIWLGYLVYDSYLSIYKSYQLIVRINVIDSPKNSTMRIYYNTGDGYNDSDSKKLKKDIFSKENIYYAFLPTTKLLGFRIDPGSKKGLWIIQSIEILAASRDKEIKKLIYQWQGNDLKDNFSAWHSIKPLSMKDNYLFVNVIGKDPYFGYDGAKLIKLIEYLGFIEKEVLLELLSINYNIRWLLVAIFSPIVLLLYYFRGSFIRIGNKNKNIISLKNIFISKWVTGAFQKYSQLIKSNVNNPVCKALIFYILLAIFVLGANPFKGETVAPLDLLLKNTGWHSVGKKLGYEGQVTHWSRSDLIDSRYPGLSYLKGHLRNGYFPDWNIHKNSPISINFLNIIFKPNHLLFFLFKDSGLGLYAGGLFQLVFSALGMFLLLQIFLSFPAALFGGIVYMLAGFYSAWFFILTVGIWIPWVFWATIKYLTVESKFWALLVTTFSAFLVFSKFYAVAGWAFYGLSIMILLWNIIYFQDYKTFFKKNVLPYFFILWAFAITFSTFMPLFDSLQRADLTYRNHPGPINLKYLKLLIDPYFLGRPPKVEFTVYTGIVSIGLSIFSFFTVLINRNKKNIFIWLLGLLIFLISISIVFGFFKTTWIRLIPLFGFNPWSRLFSLIGFSIAILSAVGLNNIYCYLSKYLATKKKYVFLLSIFVFIFLYQIIEQKKLFQQFNALTQSSWFYPETATISHVKNSIQPLQSVIADSAYFVGGTLTTYGLTEWFSHSTFSDNEKHLLGKIVDKPFRTPFAASFPGSSINFWSPYLNTFGIKYILINKYFLPKKFKNPIYQTRNIDHSAAKPLPLNKLVQHLKITQKTKHDPQSISFLFATYSRKHFNSDVKLTLRKKGVSILFDEIIINKESIKDNTWVRADFSKKLQKGEYTIEFALQTETNQKLTFWTTKDLMNRDSYLSVNGIKTNKSMQFRLYPEKMASHKEKFNAFKEKFDVLQLEPKIVLIENKQVPSGAYFVDSLDTLPEDIISSGVSAEAISDSRIRIKTNLSQPGWIVLPMKFYPGWKALAENEKHLTIKKYLGVFPAIQINQSIKSITFEYLPQKHYFGRFVSYISFILLILVFLVNKNPLSLIYKKRDVEL